MEATELVSYACQKFQEGKYDEALEGFVLAYCKGYEREWILENIYACYVDGNQQEFQDAYGKQNFENKIAYEDCMLDFIPYKDGEYYIFDKGISEFRGKFSIHELESTQPDELLQKMEYSAAALEMDWNWNDVKHILTDAKKRNIYAICHDMARCMSFWKIPELEEYLKNVRVFSNHQELQSYFHQNTAVYLPLILYGNEKEKNELIRILEQEHQYRLTPEGRNTENVLLTIAIPTANRGNLLLKRMENLLQMHYDAEIEIAISKNGEGVYQDEYDEVGRIPDARILYYDHHKGLRPTVNWHYTVEMSHGKYVLFVSDEDDVVIEALEHYLRLLTDYPEVSVMRAKSAFQGSHIQKRKYGKKGLEAFEIMFLGQNYLSGLMFRREDFLQEDLLRFEKNTDNVFYNYYPHEWWCASLSRRGDYLEEPVVLIVETDSVLEEETKKYRAMGVLPEGEGMIENSSLPGYATYEQRLKQFRGQADFIHLFMKDDAEGAEKGLFYAIAKTSYLMEMARKYKYDRENFLKYINQFMKNAMEIIDEFSLNEKQKIYLLSVIKSCGTQLVDAHAKLSDEENEEYHD